MKKDLTKNPLQNIKFNRDTVCFALFVIAWAALAMIASQYIVAYPMIWILGNAVEQPLWTLVYYILNYTIALALIILVPPRLWQSIRKNHPKATSKAGEKVATKAEKTEATAATSTKDNPLATSASELGFSTAPTFVDIGLAPVAYIAYMFFASILTSIMEIFPWYNADQAQDVGFNYFMTTGDRFLAILAIVFIAPIAEEIIMRGWLYGKLRSKLGILVSMLLVSVLFGFLHGQWNVAVTTFALSIILCGLREVTGTIWSGILLHILVNGIAFYVLYVVGI